MAWIAKNLQKFYPSFVPSNPGAAGRVVYAYQTHAGRVALTLVPATQMLGDPLEGSDPLPPRQRLAKRNVA